MLCCNCGGLPITGVSSGQDVQDGERGGGMARSDGAETCGHLYGHFKLATRAGSSYEVRHRPLLREVWRHEPPRKGTEFAVVAGLLRTPFAPVPQGLQPV